MSEKMTQPRSHCKALQSPRPFRFWNTTPDAGGREQSRHESETAQPFPSHIHLDGIQRIRVIEDKHHQREENN